MLFVLLYSKTKKRKTKKENIMKVFKKMSDDTYYGFDSFGDYVNYMIIYIICIPIGVACGIGAVWVLLKLFEGILNALEEIGSYPVN